MLKKLIRPTALFLLIGCIAMQYRLWRPDGAAAKVHHLRGQIAEQKTQNQAMRKRNELLLAEIKDLREGYDAIEERARNELGMIKQGEIFYRVVK